MTFLNYSLITLTILVISIWVMPATSNKDSDQLKSLDSFIDIEWL